VTAPAVRELALADARPAQPQVPGFAQPGQPQAASTCCPAAIGPNAIASTARCVGRASPAITKQVPIRFAGKSHAINGCGVAQVTRDARTRRDCSRNTAAIVPPAAYSVFATVKATASSFSLSPDTVQELKDAAAARGVSVSSLAQQAIERFLLELAPLDESAELTTIGRYEFPNVAVTITGRYLQEALNRTRRRAR
jgi:hypothetical protein